MRTLIISGNDLIPNDYYGNKYRYNFPVGSVSFNDDQVAVASIQMYYSWFNISSASTGSRYNNNSFSYVWYNGSGSATFNVVIPDGYYSVETLNAFFQSVMIQQGHYLVNGSGQNVFYLELTENPTYYAIQFNSFPIPTSLPSGWTNPSGLTFPATATTPQIIIPNTNFQNVIGFNAGTYPTPTQSTTYSLLSQFTPQVSPVSSLVMTCNLVQNRYAIPSTLLYSFTASGVAFGELINEKPPELSFNDITDGSYNSIEVSFLDQNLNDVKLNDTQLVILLVVRNRKEYI